MVSDEILSKEAQFIFERAYGFEPKDGDLKKWRGVVPIITEQGNDVIDVEIDIPSGYPQKAPIVRILTPLSHPNVENGLLDMRILYRWRDNYHIFQVIVEIQRLFSKVKGRIIGYQKQRPLETHNQVQSLNTQKDQLAIILKQKQEELNEIRRKKQMKMSQQVIEQETEKMVEEEVLSIENQIFATEQQFDDYEISAIEFAKKYYSLKKRYYLLEGQKA